MECAGVDQLGSAGLTSGSVAAEGCSAEAGLGITTATANAVEIDGDRGTAVREDVAGVAEGDGA